MKGCVCVRVLLICRPDSRTNFVFPPSLPPSSLSSLAEVVEEKQSANGVINSGGRAGGNGGGNGNWKGKNEGVCVRACVIDLSSGLTFTY